MARWCSIHIL